MTKEEREEAKAYFQSRLEWHKENRYPYVSAQEIRVCKIVLEALNNDIEQEPKIGYWIDDKCSVCGKGTDDLIDSPEWYRNEEPNFCPFCGLKLVNSQESENT